MLDPSNNSADALRAYKRRWYEANRDRLIAKAKLNYQNNREQKIRQAVEWGRRNPEKRKVYKTNWNHANPDKVLAAATRTRTLHREEILIRRKATDRAYQQKDRQRPVRILRDRLRARLQCAIRRGMAIKKASVLTLIGCTAPELCRYIEGLFLNGMTWNNRHLWHIDHIRPCASFDLTDSAQQKACFHYTNLRPLWAIDNMRKGARFDRPQQ